MVFSKSSQLLQIHWFNQKHFPSAFLVPGTGSTLGKYKFKWANVPDLKKFTT